jgi:predicted transposase/invertase (TIGR01784 family)
MKFMKGKTAEEQEALAKQYPEVAMAVRTINRLSWSERRRLIKEAEGLRRTDLRMLKLAAWEDGKKEGWEAGQEEGRKQLREAAKNFKTMGLPVEQIAAATGLAPEEIKAL